MNDWRQYESERPGDSWPVQFRNSRGETWVGCTRDFYPEFNVAYLEWRHTGISMELLSGDVPGERPAQIVGQMLNAMLGWSDRLNQQQWAALRGHRFGLSLGEDAS